MGEAIDGTSGGPGHLGLGLGADPLRLPGGHVVEVVGLHRPTGQDVDLSQLLAFRHPRAVLIPGDRRQNALKGVGKLLLLPPFSATPINKPHPNTSKRFPLWLSHSLAEWQYANMERGRIGYHGVVANDDDAPNRIRELREAMGLAQNQLADLLNVTPSALNKLEKGTRGLDQEWMRRLAKALECEPADILPDRDIPSRLREDESELLRRYRSANARDRETFMRVTEAIAPYTAPKRADVA